MLTNSVILEISGWDTLSPLGVYFKPLAELNILCPWAPIWSTFGTHVDQMGAHGHKMLGYGPRQIVYVTLNTINGVTLNVNLHVICHSLWKHYGIIDLPCCTCCHLLSDFQSNFNHL